jgi:hypothetical protein
MAGQYQQVVSGSSQKAEHPIAYSTLHQQFSTLPIDSGNRKDAVPMPGISKINRTKVEENA